MYLHVEDDVKEIKNIVAILDQPDRNSLRHVLATVVHVEGSSYRKPGARMLISEDGLSYGAISGGCLEDDVRKKAAAVMTKDESRIICYETTDDEELSTGLQLGCNGTIYILLEPIVPSDSTQIIGILRKVACSKVPCILVIRFSLKNLTSAQSGTYAVLFEEDLKNSLSTNRELIDNCGVDNNTIKSAFTHKKSILIDDRKHDQYESFLIQYLEPVIHLVVIGSGYDVIPLVKLTNLLGWTFTVFNKRSTTPSHGQFHVMGMLPDEIRQYVKSSCYVPRTTVVLLSHNYSFDKSVLSAIADIGIPYIGLLGPRSKFQKMKGEYKTEGRKLSQKQLAKIHSPIGLNIGSKDADEIAISIVSEIMKSFAFPEESTSL